MSFDVRRWAVQGNNQNHREFNTLAWRMTGATLTEQLKPPPPHRTAPPLRLLHLHLEFHFHLFRLRPAQQHPLPRTRRGKQQEQIPGLSAVQLLTLDKSQQTLPTSYDSALRKKTSRLSREGDLRVEVVSYHFPTAASLTFWVLLARIPIPSASAKVPEVIGGSR
ncbi:hypothetical protein B0H13DRAFT_1918654 [Mycena leptocephala]|nr:hypothetical protein B0H13DRAFT_1918654 [Mycena leptocephala]